jgi:hypothetical protein
MHSRPGKIYAQYMTHSSRIIALSWRGVLRTPMTKRVMLAGALAAGSATHARQAKR